MFNRKKVKQLEDNILNLKESLESLSDRLLMNEDAVKFLSIFQNHEVLIGTRDNMVKVSYCGRKGFNTLYFFDKYIKDNINKLTVNTLENNKDRVIFEIHGKYYFIDRHADTIEIYDSYDEINNRKE